MASSATTSYEASVEIHDQQHLLQGPDDFYDTPHLWRSRGKRQGTPGKRSPGSDKTSQANAQAGGPFHGEYQSCSSNFDNKVEESFKDLLTPDQIEIALKMKKKARWTQEELSRAFIVRYFSKRAYIYIQESSCIYPLPGLSTLQQWAANISLRNGVLTDALRIMEATN